MGPLTILAITAIICGSAVACVVEICGRHNTKEPEETPETQKNAVHNWIGHKVKIYAMKDLNNRTGILIESDTTGVTIFTTEDGEPRVLHFPEKMVKLVASWDKELLASITEEHGITTSIETKQE